MHILNPKSWALLAACVLLPCACGGDDSPAAIDATPSASADASSPDADPGELAYPDGPYGTVVGATLINLQFDGYADSAIDADSDPFNEDPRLYQIAEAYAANDPDAKLIMFTVSAGWCGPCMEEASIMGGIAEEYMPRGVRFITALPEDENGAPASAEFVHRWGTTYGLPFPTLIDSQSILNNLFDEQAFPANLFIDASNMKILASEYGFGGADYVRAELDGYLAQ